MMMSLTEEGGQTKNALSHGKRMTALLGQSLRAQEGLAQALEKLGGDDRLTARQVRACAAGMARVASQAHEVVETLASGEQPRVYTVFQLLTAMSEQFKTGVSVAMETAAKNPMTENLRAGYSRK